MWKASRTVLIVSVVALTSFLFIFAACSSDDDDTPSATDTPDTAEEPTDVPADEIDLTIGTLASVLLFDKTELIAPAGEPFTITYDNTDGGVPHNFSLYSTEQAYKDDEEAIAATETLAGPIVQELDVPALDAGEYFFICIVHPTTMFGTLRVIE